MISSTNGFRSRNKHNFRPLVLLLSAAKVWLVLDLVSHGQGPGILRPTLSLLSVHEILLLIAGIEVNPGPYTPKFPCMFCGKAARWKQRCLQCNLCSAWYHADCLGMWTSLYKEHEEHPSLSWICQKGCGMPQFWNRSSSLFCQSNSVTSQTPSIIPLPLCTPPPSATSTPTVPAFPPSQDVLAPNISDVSESPSCTNSSVSKPPLKNHNELSIIVSNCQGVTG